MEKTQGRSSPTWPLMLLEPSTQALRRISMETAHPGQYPSFPRRRGPEQGDISTYLTSVGPQASKILEDPRAASRRYFCR
eukprot:s889_g5.t1